MRLTKEDADLYYALWLPLLDYVNETYQINSHIGKMAGGQGLDPVEVKEIADRLWEDTSVISEYLAKRRDGFSEEDKDILRSWERRVRGRFILERHLKKGSMLIELKNNAVYQVSGIRSSWEEMLMGWQAPIMLEATILPFKDVIIPDGIVMPYRVRFGSGMKKEMKEIYMNAKQSGEIRSTL